MGVIRFTSEAYARAQKALLPQGRLWNLDVSGFVTKVFLGSGDELERVSDRAADLIEEEDPRTTTELITDYESELALTATGTLQNRRDRVEALYTRRQRFRPVDVQAALAVDLDMAAASIVVIETSRADAIAMSDDTAIYHFYVFDDGLAGGSADLVAAQATLDSIAHSHTLGTVIESDDFLCDDSQSLCDRDILGV